MDVRPLLAALLVAAVVPAAAAPFVAGDPQPLASRIAASRAAVTARPADDSKAGWRIVTVLHDANNAVEPGRVINPRPAPPPGTKLALLISNLDATVEAIPLSDEAAAYLANLPSPGSSAEDRLRFALEHLDHADPLVAADAFAELARFTAAEFKTHKSLLTAETLRNVVDDRDASGDRVGLAGYLLGLCGTPDDARRLRRRFLSSEGFADGAAGLAAGYLSLAREQGLADLEATLLARDDVSPLLAAALFEALAFFRVERTGPFRPDRLRLTACVALARPETADLAVGHLAAGREWAALPEVIALLVAEDPNAERRRAAQVAAVRFLEECRRDADAPRSVRSAADATLSKVVANDPDLARRATVLSGGPPARR